MGYDIGMLGIFASQACNAPCERPQQSYIEALQQAKLQN